MPTRYLRLSLLLLGLAGCAAPGPTPPPSAAAAQTQPLPANIRPDLNPRWLDPAAGFRWPQGDGFAAAPVPVVLPPGVLIDRFGSDTGRFFSPKGASYAARSLPYACEKLTYTAYRVAQPLVVWTGKAAPWFDEPGGATQFQTDAPASRLMADHVIETVQSPGMAPC